MDATETKPTARVGIVTAGDIVTAYLLPDGKPSEAMKIHYTACIAANMDAEMMTVDPEAWERLRDAVSDIEGVEVQDFTAETTEP